jgi:hypothetical protein
MCTLPFDSVIMETQTHDSSLPGSVYACPAAVATYNTNTFLSVPAALTQHRRQHGQFLFGAPVGDPRSLSVYTLGGTAGSGSARRESPAMSHHEASVSQGTHLERPGEDQVGPTVFWTAMLIEPPSTRRLVPNNSEDLVSVLHD